MLRLPKSTEINIRVPKEKIYEKAEPAPQVRDAIKAQIESIFWRNKLADTTVGLYVGESVTEIQIFEIQLRQRNLDARALQAIAKAIPYKIIFILTFEDECQAWIETCGMLYNTEWVSVDALSLKLDGLNLDDVYENVVHQITGGRLSTSETLAEAVNRDKYIQKLERDIVALQNKIQNEKQFNKQVELNGELKRLEKILEELE